MFRFGVDIKRLIFRFSVWPIFSGVKVEGDVKKVGLDKICFGGDLEAVLLKYFDDFLFYFVYTLFLPIICIEQFFAYRVAFNQHCVVMQIPFWQVDRQILKKLEKLVSSIYSN